MGGVRVDQVDWMTPELVPQDESRSPTLGARAAKRLGDAHEWGDKCRGTRCDTYKDQYNNRQARIFASSSYNRYWMRYYNKRGYLLQYLYRVADWLYWNRYLKR